jgi:predicted HicB family RNase H-like nuclease
MNISHLTTTFEQDLQRLAKLGGPDMVAVVERLGELMIPILQQRMLEQFGALVTEYNQLKNREELELRVANNQIHMVSQATEPEPTAETIGDLDARFALRLPSMLKERIDAHATAEGMSTNSWVVRTLNTATTTRPTHTQSPFGQTLRGRGRS